MVFSGHTSGQKMKTSYFAGFFFFFIYLVLTDSKIFFFCTKHIFTFSIYI